MPNKDSLSTEQKIGQLFFIGIPATTIDDAARKLIETVRPGGVCLFARNISDAAQTRALCDDLRSNLDIEPFIAVDQEGGLVDRLRRILGPMPAASKIDSAETAGKQAALIGEALQTLGFNMDFAPVVDVISEERAGRVNGLHSRAYGSTAADVVAYASAFLDSLQSKNILGCLKHFPGQGASSVDSHEELPTVNLTDDEFRAVDLYPYRSMLQIKSVRAVMVAHAAYPNLELQETDRNGKLLPSSLSFKFVSNLLRKELGFDGLVLTDDLEMGAILKNYGIGEASLMAINAGNDMVAICAKPDLIFQAHENMLAAFNDGRLETKTLDNAVERIFRLKSVIPEPIAMDMSGIELVAQQITALNQSLS